MSKREYPSKKNDCECTQTYFKKILADLKPGWISEEKALSAIQTFSYASLGFGTTSHYHSPIASGISGSHSVRGKTPQGVSIIAKKIVERGSTLLATRASEKDYTAVRKVVKNAHYQTDARTITANEPNPSPTKKMILVVTAETSDIPVAEETVVTAKVLQQKVETMQLRRRRGNSSPVESKRQTS